MEQFKTIFEAYGASYQNTMERFMGNETMYLRFLGMLFQDDNLKKLGDALQRGDMTGAFEAAHTLKGVVGNMGLTPLYKAVCAIVDPLRTREVCDNYSALYQAIQVEFERVGQLRQDLQGGAST